MHVCKLSHFSRIQLFVTLWTIVHKASLSVEFSRQGYWSVLPCPSPGMKHLYHPRKCDEAHLWLVSGVMVNTLDSESSDPSLNLRGTFLYGFPDSSVGKESICNAGDPGLIPRLGRFIGEGIGFPLHYSWVSFMAQQVKNLPEVQETWVWSLSQEDLGRREWQPTPVFLPGKS